MDNKLCKNINEGYVLNPKAYENKRKYIWFSRDRQYRREMLNLFKILLFFEIYVDGFTTDIAEDIGLKIFNKKIIDINVLDANNSIVFANIDYIKYPICSPLKIKIRENERNINQELYYIPEGIDGFQLKDKIFLRVYRIVEMIGLLKDKEIFIYGNNVTARRFAKYLRLLDFNFKGFFCDYEQINEEKIDGYFVKCIEEILYENNGFVIIENDNLEMSARKMELLGYKYGIDFVFSEPFATHFLFVRENALDINLGNTYIGTSKYEGVQITTKKIFKDYPGFCIYGNLNSNDYKIVTLGGSTTDGNLFHFKSWPEILYEKINISNITIFNGGVAGYTSGHELIKLIRDVLQIKPDMIITFDGFNDTYQIVPEHPYSFIYSKEVYNFGSKNIADEYVSHQIGTEVCEGVISKNNSFENWLNNIELMKEISIYKKIKFFSFLQPMLSNKKRSKHEEEIYISSREFFEQNLYNSISFRKEIEKIQTINPHNYINDLSHIFDNYSDIYMDICHVYENGNEIIADSIFNIIKDEIYLI